MTPTQLFFSFVLLIDVDSLFKLTHKNHAVELRTVERNAHENLYRDHVDRVLVFARQLTGNQADAEDLTQEVFLAAFRCLDRFEGRSSILSWLIAIAVRRWRDELRRRQPQCDISLEELTPPHRPHAITDNDVLANQIISNTVLTTALEKLNLPLREAFLLVAQQGFTHREVAEILETPVGTIKWRVAEAVRRLRRTLTEQETADRELSQNY